MNRWIDFDLREEIFPSFTFVLLLRPFRFPLRAFLKKFKQCVCSDLSHLKTNTFEQLGNLFIYRNYFFLQIKGYYNLFFGPFLAKKTTTITTDLQTTKRLVWMALPLVISYYTSQCDTDRLLKIFWSNKQKINWHQILSKIVWTKKYGV